LSPQKQKIERREFDILSPRKTIDYTLDENPPKRLRYSEGEFKQTTIHNFLQTPTKIDSIFPCDVLDSFGNLNSLKKYQTRIDIDVVQGGSRINQQINTSPTEINQESIGLSPTTSKILNGIPIPGDILDSNPKSLDVMETFTMLSPIRGKSHRQLRFDDPLESHYINNTWQAIHLLQNNNRRSLVSAAEEFLRRTEDSNTNGNV